MSIRTINGISGGSSSNVYVNSMFQSGEAIEVVQTSNTTQAKVNVSMKTNTDSTTTLNDDDWLLVADNATGKIVKRITVSNVKNEATHWTLNSTKLYPDATTYNVLLGTTSNTNSRKLMVNGTGEFTGILTLGSTINDLTLPTGTKTLATLTGTEIFTNKTLTTPIIDQINNSSSRNLMSQSGATTITIGNTTDITSIFGCDSILNSNERGLFSYIPASNRGTLGNSGDDLLIEKATCQTACVWNGQTIGIAYGGTGFVGIGKGEIYYASDTDTLAKLNIGSAGEVLKVSAGLLPVWATDNDTNYFTKSGSNVNLTNLSENLLVGTSSNSVSAKLNIVGNTQLNGTLKNAFTGLYSFSFINNSFYNDANRTIHLEQDSGTYGYNHTAYDATPATYSDVATYCSSTGTAISAIGSRNNNRFGLYANENWFMIASPANRNYVCLGQATRFNSGITPLAALHIENSVSDLSAQDTTIFVKSNSSTYDSRLTFSVNSATDGSGSAQETYIDANSSKNLKFTATDISMFLFGGSEKYRFTGGSLQCQGTNLITTRTPPTSSGNTVETNLRISGGNGTTTSTGWGVAGGQRYYVESFIPPTHTGGPFHTWVEDTGSANFGWSYGSSFLIAMDSSSNLVGASTWTTSDERIKEDIVNADPNECINIIKRLPLKKYKYKKELRENCIGFNDKSVYGWIAQQFKEDPDMSYAWRTYDKMKYYDKETNSQEVYEVDNIEIINKSSINAVSWGAITGLIDIVEKQQAIIDKLTNATSFKNFKDSL